MTDSKKLSKETDTELPTGDKQLKTIRTIHYKK